MTIETDEDLQALMRMGAFVARTLREVRALVRPGISTAELDLHGERMLSAWEPHRTDGLFKPRTVARLRTLSTRSWSRKGSPLS